MAADLRDRGEREREGERTAGDVSGSGLFVLLAARRRIGAVVGAISTPSEGVC